MSWKHSCYHCFSLLLLFLKIAHNFDGFDPTCFFHLAFATIVSEALIHLQNSFLCEMKRICIICFVWGSKRLWLLITGTNIWQPLVICAVRKWELRGDVWFIFVVLHQLQLCDTFKHTIIFCWKIKRTSVCRNQTFVPHECMSLWCAHSSFSQLFGFSFYRNRLFVTYFCSETSVLFCSLTSEERSK